VTISPPDEEGLELPSIERVQEEAARSLADMARDAVRTSRDGADHRMAIEVRDDNGPVLEVKFTFEIDRHQP
jgi:gamma-glutamylcysteine synthetase